MSRPLWFGAGVAAGVYAVVRARRVAEALTVDGLRDRIGAAYLGARMLVEEVDQGRADAEHTLRERYRLAVADQHGPAALPAADPADPGPDRAATPTELSDLPEKGTHR